MAKKLTVRLADIMKERGLTQGQLADITGIRQAAISQLSRGFVSRISVEHIEKIATTLGIDDMNELFTLKTVDNNSSNNVVKNW